MLSLSKHAGQTDARTERALSPWNPFRRRDDEVDAAPLYAAVVAQARRPAFYLAAGVPDSLDGRFELIALHLYLVLHRLKRGGEGEAALAQATVDAFTADMDASLREMGAGDLGVGKRVQRMAAGFYGRVGAYDAAGDGPALTDALRRNLYGTVAAGAGQLAVMADYLARAQAMLAGQATADLSAGRPRFPDPSAFPWRGPGTAPA